MGKPFGYVTIDSYADAKRIPINVATEQVQSGKVIGKQVDGEWFVSEEELATSGDEFPAIILALLYFSAIVIFLAALAISYISWPNGYSTPREAYIFPCVILASGAVSSLTLSAIAKGLELLHSISISVSSKT